MNNQKLTTTERCLLVIPMLGALVFGLFPFFGPQLFAFLIGYPGNYPYIYEIAGAANLGYLVVLYMAVTTGNLLASRFSIVATLFFNLAALYTVLSEMYRGRANMAVYIVGVVSLLIVLITFRILRAHPYKTSAKGTLSVWATRVLGLSILSALIFGIVPLIPRLFIPLFGYAGVDAGILKIAGAATFGYAVMGFRELSSKVWAEVKWPLIMGLTFNGLAFAASLLQLSQGQNNILVWLVTLAAGFFTISFTAILMRQGR